MEPETAPQAEAAAPVRRLPRKLLIVAGGSAVLLAVLGGLLVWLWPSAPAKPARHARAVAAAASAASAASAAESVAGHAAPLAAAPVEPAAAAEPTSAAHAAAPAPHDGHAAATEAPAAAAMLAAASTPRGVEPSHDAAPVPPTAPPPPAPSTEAVASRKPASEASLDRLQRRLGEVLGARGAVDSGQPGEWRVTTRAMAVPVAAPSTAPAGHPGHGVDWSYAGQNGPQAWAKLHPDFATCASGKRQSPIDIRDGLALDLEAIRFDYRPGAFSVVDNGHTVQVNVAPGSTLEIMGRRYQLQQFHFHRPSEERIGGRRYEMSAHFVHKDAEGRLAVVAVMLERGADHPLLQAVWSNLPLEQGEEQLAPRPLDPAQLLPADRRYYSYMGSLTTPPCSEGVLWLVLQQPVGASPRQIEIFSRLYPMNARPVQRTAGRLIKQSN